MEGKILGKIIDKKIRGFIKAERVSYTEEQWFIEYIKDEVYYLGGTAYHSRQEAANGIKEAARLFGFQIENAIIKRKYETKTKIVIHRHRKG